MGDGLPCDRSAKQPLETFRCRLNVNIVRSAYTQDNQSYISAVVAVLSLPAQWVSLSCLDIE